MVAVLFLLALASVAGGAAAAFFGSDILLADRGLPMIIVGGTVASAGLVLLGLAVVAAALRRLDRRLVSLGAFAEPAGPATRPLAADKAFPDGRPSDVRRTVESDEIVLPPVQQAAPAARGPVPSVRDPGVTVVGRYASGGNSYIMYSDDSIDADTPAGRHRFASLDELRAFVAAGGERGEPS